MATPVIRTPVAEERERDEEQKLLEENNEVLIVPAVRDEEGLLSVKSSKKVKLPEDVGPAVGAGRFTIGPAPERDWEMVPPDGQWGWCVLVGATLVNILIPGTIKSFGVLLVEFYDVFETTPSASSGIVALCYFLYSSLGPISSILSVKWSYRTVTLIGGSFAAFGMIASSFAFCITFLYFRGAVLILGGIMLNVWAAALLFQPVEEHMVKKYKEPEEDEDGPQDDILFEEEEPMETYNMNYMTSIQEGVANGQAKDVHPPSLHNSQNCMATVPSQNQLKHNLSKRKLSYTKPKTTSSITLDGIADAKKLGSQEAFSRRLSSAGPKRNYSTSSFAYVSTPFHGSTLSAFEKPNEFASQFSLKSITDSVADVAYCCFCCKKKKDKEPNKFFDISLLTDPTYLVILISSSTVAISCTNFIILLPSHAQAIGFDKSQGALLLSTVSALDLVGRIGGSALCDLNFMPKTFYFVGGLFFSGIALGVLPFLHTYVSISVCCGFFGLASGINNGVTTLVMAEILGVERLMSTYGISLFVNGLLQLVGPPICGLWFERERNYTSMFVTFGLIFVGGAALWLLMPIINWRKREKARRESELKDQKV